jgi:hypothetical protein
MDSYTTLAAQEMVSRGEVATLGRLLVDPTWTFFRTYFLKLGFLDGAEGLAIAYMGAFYNFLKYSKARHMSPGRKS